MYCRGETQFIPDDLNDQLRRSTLTPSGNSTDDTGFDSMVLASSMDHMAPGIVRGCYIIDSVLLSTLECFYTGSKYMEGMLYYTNMLSYIEQQVAPTFTIRPLADSPALTQFPPNTSLSSVVKKMMIEQWNISLSFDHYYQTCAPAYCTYTQTVRAQSFMGVLLTLISMIGGLSVALQLCTPVFVNGVFGLFKPKVEQPRRGN